MYAYMYEQVFRIFRETYGYTVRWKHIDGEGIAGITIDQDFKNITGI
jgi:hypothetical protein